MRRPSRGEEFEAESALQTARDLRKSGRNSKAVEICRQLVRRYPDYVGALYELSQIHIEKKEYDKALHILVDAAMHNPHDFRILANVGALYFELGAYEMAEATNRHAIAVNPNSRESRVNLGNTLVKLRKYEAAASEYQRALELDKNYFDAAIKLGQCYQHLGMISEAVNIYLSSFNMPSADKKRSLYALSDLPQKLVGIDVLTELDKLQ
ncbi:MAG: tetratricopeptide repeat protein, partial [Alphaproteobacteria bacterium]|nr:tetratricopeptide repeat protein [Alphaproteobacteria bacterium]